MANPAFESLESTAAGRIRPSPWASATTKKGSVRLPSWTACALAFRDADGEWRGSNGGVSGAAADWLVGSGGGVEGDRCVGVRGNSPLTRVAGTALPSVPLRITSLGLTRPSAARAFSLAPVYGPEIPDLRSTNHSSDMALSPPKLPALPPIFLSEAGRFTGSDFWF
jgi:hypothetical protein